MKTREIILKRIKAGTNAGEITYSNQLTPHLKKRIKGSGDGRENKRQILNKLEKAGLIKKCVGRPGVGYTTK